MEGLALLLQSTWTLPRLNVAPTPMISTWQLYACSFLESAFGANLDVLGFFQLLFDGTASAGPLSSRAYYSFGDVHLKLNLTAKAPRQSVAPLPVARIIPTGFSLNPFRLVKKLNPFGAKPPQAADSIENYRVVKTTVRGPKRWTVSPLFCCGEAHALGEVLAVGVTVLAETPPPGLSRC